MSEFDHMLVDYSDKSIEEIKVEIDGYLNSPANTLVGKPPKEAQREMDMLALYAKSGYDDDNRAFNRIHSYLHSYIFNEAYSHFAIKGMEGKDIYQKALIALWEKAIPSFDPNRGMSFVNFAKMCIYRHLVTLLNMSNNRKKDQALNTAVSIDASISKNDEDKECGTMANMLADDGDFIEKICADEDKKKTIKILMDVLSPLEKSVFKCYLEKMTYREIAVSISKCHGRTYDEKSVDNALLRIRSKAYDMKEKGDMPLFSFE
jgi:RNA polymerase sporulation-specific sigma factor